jgi:hypothetical protein
VTNEQAAYALAGAPFPGHFGIIYKIARPTKNEKENEIVTSARAKVAGQADWQILQKTFDRLK